MHTPELFWLGEKVRQLNCAESIYLVVFVLFKVLFEFDIIHELVE